MASGLQDIPLRRIPEAWDRQWFADFVRDVLRLGDARNMEVGTEFSLTGQSAEVATLSMALGSVDLDKLAPQPSLSIIGNPAATTAPLQALVVTDSGRINFTLSDGADTFTADIVAASIDTGFLANNAATDSILRDSAALSVIGRSTATPGDPADLVGSADQVLRVNTAGTVLDFGTVATGGLAANAATNAKLATMVQATIKGRAAAAGTGDPTDLTAAQVAAIVNASLDHGTLLGLADDDHTQYVLRSILTTNGDLFVRAAGVVDRLGIGTASQVLRTIAGAPSWQTISPVLTLGTDLSGNTTFTDLASATLNATIVNDAVTNAKAANMADSTIKGRASGAGTGDPTDLTAAQVATILGTSLGANPSGTIGLTAVNGSAGTYLRSDSAPALSQAIAPTWSAQHIFSLAGNLATPTLLMSSTQPVLMWDETDSLTNADERKWAALPATKVLQRRSVSDSGGASIIWESITRGTGTAIADMRWGDPTNNNTYTFNSTGLCTFTGSVSAATLIPSGGAAPTNGLYLPNTNNPGISANSTKVLDCISTAVRVTGNLSLTTAGNKVLIKEGTNASMGVATLVLGTVVVNTTLVTATSRILLTVQVLGTVAVATAIAVTARTAGTSFTITSAGATDTSTVAWMIVEPA